MGKQVLPSHHGQAGNLCRATCSSSALPPKDADPAILPLAPDLSFGCEITTASHLSATFTLNPSFKGKAQSCSCGPFILYLQILIELCALLTVSSLPFSPECGYSAFTSKTTLATTLALSFSGAAATSRWLDQDSFSARLTDLLLDPTPP